MDYNGCAFWTYAGTKSEHKREIRRESCASSQSAALHRMRQSKRVIPVAVKAALQVCYDGQHTPVDTSPG